MIQQSEIERYLDDWLGNAPMPPADRLVVAVAVRIGRERQRPAPRFAWAVADLVRGRALAPLAAVLIIAALALAALRYGNLPPFGQAPTSTPISTSVAVSNPTPEPTAAPTPSPAAPTATIAPAINVTLSDGLPSGWNVAAAGLLQFATDEEPPTMIELVADRMVMAADCTYGPEPDTAATSRAFVDSFAERDGLTTSNVRPFTVGGFAGRQVDVLLDTSVGPTCELEEFGFVPLFGGDGQAGWEFVGVGEDEHLRVIVLDIPTDRNLVILIVAPDVSSFERHIVDAMSIVENLEIIVGD